MVKVFVSYASPDKDVTFQIIVFLEANAIPSWVAPRDLPPGVEYGAAIINAIGESCALVLVLSEHSNESPFVRREAERAASKGKPVLPVRIRQGMPSGALEFFVSSAQWVDAWASDGGGSAAPRRRDQSKGDVVVVYSVNSEWGHVLAKPILPPRAWGCSHHRNLARSSNRSML